LVALVGQMIDQAIRAGRGKRDLRQ
jgi:hypothetical protein